MVNSLGTTFSWRVFYILFPLFLTYHSSIFSSKIDTPLIGPLPSIFGGAYLVGRAYHGRLAYLPCFVFFIINYACCFFLSRAKDEG